VGHNTGDSAGTTVAILRVACSPPSVILCALAYITRRVERNPELSIISSGKHCNQGMYISQGNIHGNKILVRLLHTSCARFISLGNESTDMI